MMGQPQDLSTNPHGADVIIQSNEELKHKPRKWYYYLWDTLDKPKEERWFMFKLDAALLTFASLGMITKFCRIDYRANLEQDTLLNTWIKQTLTTLSCRGCMY
jgi:hypothetical protein